MINWEEADPAFPTQSLPAEFWEALGRAIGSFGLLEEVLGRAVYRITGAQQIPAEDREEAIERWIGTVMKATASTLTPAARMFADAVAAHQPENRADAYDLMEMVRVAAIVRDALCHASWSAGENGEAVPFYLDRHRGWLETPIDIDFLTKTRRHVAELAVAVQRLSS